MNRESPSFEAALSSLPAHDADIACIADAACMLWGSISGALAPIIGTKGVDALYRRSLHLTAPRHPVLSSINNDRAVGDFGSLREVLLSQTNAVAAAAHKALLINFHNLLSSLIGESLTERLLASVWDNPPGQCPRQERAPMTTGKATIHRLATGVHGLDEVLGGGLPEFSFNILAGPPGSGKTTLAHQLMFGLATAERPALYFTVLGEPPLKMLRYMQQFAFFSSDAVNRSVHFINLADDAATGDLNQVLLKIVAAVEHHAPAFVFVDSFRSVMLASEGNNRSFVGLQKFVQQLGMLMTSWQATTFLIGEYFTDADPNPVFTVADGLIWLRQSALRNSVVRKLEIVKMRGQPSLPGLHTFRIDAEGVSVFPPAQLAVHAPAVAPAGVLERLCMGVARLDGLMGGGLPRGYSLLVAGPSGSGKTILASAFLVEGARCGETGIIAAFEQRPTLARGRVVEELITAGKISVVDTRSTNLSVDEMSMTLMAEIRRTGATRIVLDSLSGFELALAPTFREDFREALARMVPALTSAGATVLMTSELEDRYDDLRFSPYGTAFLTDAIIVQRYIEVDSRLLRVMAVVKVRGSAHSNELRLFRIDDTGICIGEMVADHEGLLGGRPTRRPPAVPMDP